MTYTEWRCDCGVHCETLEAWRDHKHMSAERQKRYRDRKRGGPARVPQPCGTVAAYKRHLRHGEPPCDACRAANAEAQRTYQSAK